MDGRLICQAAHNKQETAFTCEKSVNCENTPCNYKKVCYSTYRTKRGGRDVYAYGTARFRVSGEEEGL